MEGVKSSLNKEKVIYSLMFFITGAFTLLVSVVSGAGYEEVLRNTIVAFIISGVVLFMLQDAQERGENGFYYDNYSHRFRFIIAYFVMVILSCIFSFVPNVYWPYMSVFVILSLLSNAEIGIASGTCFVMLSVLLEENGSYSEFFMYALAGIVAIALFRDLKENTSIGLPLFMASLIQGVLLVAFNVLFQNRTLSIKLLILPILNLMLNLIILLVFLNMFGVYIIRKSNDMYMEINDVEYPLLAALKEKNKDEYYRAVHTGYLSEKVAMGLGLNDRAVKSCAYYSRIGIAEGKTKWEDTEPIFLENNFPMEAVELLHEYIEPEKGKIKSPEALSVQVSSTIISTIMYAMKKDKDAKLDYDKLIDTFLDRMEKERELTAYQITYREFDQMRKILKKEKLYYDFLR